MENLLLLGVPILKHITVPKFSEFFRNLEDLETMIVLLCNTLNSNSIVIMIFPIVIVS